MSESREVVKRGDSFDIGDNEPTDLTIQQLLSNPQNLVNSLNLTGKQVGNVKSLIVGGGTGGIHKLLSQHFGDEIAGAIGGLVSGWLAKRVIGR